MAAGPYHTLVASRKHAEVSNVVGQSGVNYQIEINMFWDSKPDGDLRIMASFDDGARFSGSPIH